MRPDAELRARLLAAPGAVLTHDVPWRGAVRRLRLRWPRVAGTPELLIVHDAQNAFSASEHGTPARWALEDALDELERAGAIAPQLVIGLDHAGSDRIAEFSPWPDELAAPGAGAHAARYEALVLDVAAPLGQALGALPDPRRTTLLGTSLGGLVSLWIAARRPSRFGRVVALSPSVMWADGRIVRTFPGRRETPLRVYVDAGSEERFDVHRATLDYGGAVRRFGRRLRALGHDEHALRVRLDPGAAHGEPWWARRLPGALAWTLGAPATSPAA